MHAHKIKVPSFEKRKADCDKVMGKYPDKIPVVCEIHEKASIPALPKSMFLVPNDMTVHQLNYVIRKRLDLAAEETIYLMVNKNYLLKADSILGAIYSEKKDLDGYLYITITQESSLG